MFLGWKNQYCQNDYTTQGNPQIQCNPYQNINGIFNRNRTNNPKICMEPHTRLMNQSSFEKEKSQRPHAP